MSFIYRFLGENQFQTSNLIYNVLVSFCQLQELIIIYNLGIVSLTMESSGFIKSV